MTPDRLQAIAPFIAIGVFILGALLFLLSLRYLRKGRTDAYWRARRTAGQRGWQLFLWAVGLMVLSGVICGVTGVAALINAHAARSQSVTQASMQNTLPSSLDTSTPPTASLLASLSPATTNEVAGTQVTGLATASAATAAPEVTPTPAPTETSTLRVVTATPPPIPTQSPTISSTPTETLVPALAVSPTLDSSVTPGADARLTITALDTQISADFTPVSPGVRFAAGFNRIYFFVKYSGMQNGILWRRQLLFGSTTLDNSLYLWGQGESSGTAYFFFGQEGGFKTGRYEIRLYIGATDQPATTAIFTVQ
ncbi:MAG TPA: hypothetical protein VKQ72_11855 [Aggregatilineales bacterium]|nr:hypothetical protein [Aggregatilineales bacterium]